MAALCDNGPPPDEKQRRRLLRLPVFFIVFAYFVRYICFYHWLRFPKS